VSNLGKVLLRVYSGTILAIIIEIGSYLADKEQKISWHSFFETWCISIHKAHNVSRAESEATMCHQSWFTIT